MTKSIQTLKEFQLVLFKHNQERHDFKFHEEDESTKQQVCMKDPIFFKRPIEALTK